MKTIKVTATRLTNEAAQYFVGLLPRDVPYDIARISDDNDRIIAVYHVNPPTNTIPPRVADGIYRLMDERSRPGDTFTIEYTSSKHLR